MDEQTCSCSYYTIGRCVKKFYCQRLHHAGMNGIVSHLVMYV